MDIHSVPQIQAEFQLSEHQIKSREACLAQFEKLQGEIQDLHQMFNELHGEVHLQKEGNLGRKMFRSFIILNSSLLKEST